MITLQAEKVTDIVVIDSNGNRYKLEEENNLNRLKNSDSLGEIGDMKWLEKVTGMSNITLKDKILYPYQAELQEFVSFPGHFDKFWRFKKSDMLKWLDKNWHRYMK